ncbi:hypothetical protein BGZ92_010928 [Podila epicladia]|nr:hypothetical protein BGZ92_010928 [Podila epicladia]
MDADAIWHNVAGLSNKHDELRRLWFGTHCAWSGPNSYATAEESAAFYAMIAKDCLRQTGYHRVAGHVVGGAMRARPEVLLQACIDAKKSEKVTRAQHGLWERGFSL